MFHRQGIGVLLGELAASHAEYGPVVYPDIALVTFEAHAVGVEREEFVRHPYYLHISALRKYVFYGLVGKVSFAGGSQTAVECHYESVCFGGASYK